MIGIKKLSLLLLCAIIVPVGLSHAVPRLFSYQGLLTDAAGLPMTGPVSITISLYDAATDGQLLFTEQHNNTPLNKGVFSLYVGSATVGGLPDNAISTSEVWLGIQVNGDAELQPRTQIVMAPFALKSFAAEMLTIPDSMTPALSVSPIGNIGIGTTSPSASLDLRGRMIVGDAFTPNTTHAQNIINVIVGEDTPPDSSGISFYDKAQIPLSMHIAYQVSQERNHLAFYNATNQLLMSIEQAGRIAMDNNTFVLDAENHRVGIGTSTPEAKLHVAGDLKVDGRIIQPQLQWYSGHFSSFVQQGPERTVKIGPLLIEGVTPGESITLHAPIHLPHGATVKRLIAFGVDTVPDDHIDINLMRFEFARGRAESMINIISTTTPAGDFDESSYEGTMVIDNEHFSYSIRLDFDVPADPKQLRFGGYRIAYTLE